MNIRFNDKAAEALRAYVKTKENKVIRLKVLGRG
jgi:Fe-S cluster assembly iron-binding protein IscA